MSTAETPDRGGWATRVSQQRLKRFNVIDPPESKATADGIFPLCQFLLPPP